MDDSQWAEYIRNEGTAYQKSRLAQLSKKYALLDCRAIMAAESQGDKYYQAALKAAKERKR